MSDIKTGTIGTCSWSLENGVLTVFPTNGEHGTLKYFSEIGYGYRHDLPFNVDDVKHIVVKQGVSADKDIRDLFRNFYTCESADLSELDVSHTENMSGLFRGCNGLREVDVSTWNTQKVTDMSYMFAGCRSLKSLDLSSFSIANVKNMDWMFSWCDQLEDLRMNIPEDYKKYPRMFELCPGGPEGKDVMYKNLELCKE